MEILNASDAKRKFGEVLLKAQKGPVGINKNGNLVAVMVSASDYADIETLKRTLIRQEVQKGLADIDAGRVISGSEVLQCLRSQVTDADR